MATEPPRIRRLAAPLAAAGAAVLGAVALHVRDPHVPGSWGFCPTALLGLDCPACGSLRAVHDLTDLDLAAAASSNLLLVLALPVVLVLWLRRLRAGWRGGEALRPLRLPGSVLVGMVLLAGAFMVVRNLSWGAWLAA